MTKTRPKMDMATQNESKIEIPEMIEPFIQTARQVMHALRKNRTKKGKPIGKRHVKRETSLAGFEKLPKKGMRRQCHLRRHQTTREVKENITKFLLPQLNTIYGLTNPTIKPQTKKATPLVGKYLIAKFNQEQLAKLKAIRVLCEKNNDILEQFWKIPQPEPQHA